MCSLIQCKRIITRRCYYKQNLPVGTDPTYSTVKPIKTSLIAWHEVETTCTSDGLVSKAMKGEEGEVRDLQKIPLRTTQPGYCPPSSSWVAKMAWGFIFIDRGVKMRLLIFESAN